MFPVVGIEAMGIAIPARYLELRELAQARGVDPQKYRIGLGANRMAVPDPGEDTVALAATAAERLLALSGVDRSSIGMLAVGTETAVDHAKPVASHVHGLLGLPSAMRVFDVTHACFGGTAALMACVEWIASGASRGRSGIVICSDIARYGLSSAGEPTQGGGAVALLVSQRPELLALDFGISGSSSQDVYDFYRPHGAREAIVDGHYSIQCYLRALEEAFAGYRECATRSYATGARSFLSTELHSMVYHLPFCKMAAKAHRHLFRLDQPTSDEPAGTHEIAEARSYEELVAPTLRMGSEVGNCYTASLYLALASLLDASAVDLAGRRIGLFSYGSGCSSEFFSGVVGRGAAAYMRKLDLNGLLSSRERIDMSTYEHIMRLRPDEPSTDAPRAEGFRFTGIRDQRRMYERSVARTQRPPTL